MAEPLFRIRNLKIRIQNGGETGYPVNDISYDLCENETLGIVGESGSGKSMHVLAMLGLLPRGLAVESGEIVFAGRDLLKMNAQELRNVRGKEIGIVFQDPMTSLNPVLTVGRQISEVLVRHKRLDWRSARARARELLELVGIPDAERRMRAFPFQFSGGMRQRVMIATALACEPRLLIADEATTALDVTIQAQVIDLIRSLKERFGMSVLWITHDIGVVAGFAETVQVMYAGQIMERGPVRSVFYNPASAYTWSLLKSLPRPDQVAGEPLYQIPGQPPNPFRLAKGDPFAERNPFATPRCFEERPALRPVGDVQGHEVAAWYDLKTRIRETGGAE
ncbi:oligopeptide transport system ATP-binding protein [Xaviernesmea oryzae]|uniref:Oligopeptide transport system ATP-binding protein n=1 Tax=Xaviernesmea oryzae TaxID=464029 RepID=A0A1X7FXT9_9HYPH|nr:ABC transporter ATP-binding protein [Xaviernesmea oryzae]SMF59928.1 oligopeptide transport system ATP-binding protein [Xaviernesmea oryzae]